MFGATAPDARATLSPYQPTLRDRASLAMLRMLGNGPVANHFVDGMMGGTGLGHEHTGLVDWVPGLGQAFQADEAGRQISDGHPWAGAANVALAALPIPAAVKGARGLIGAGARVVEGTAARAAEKALAPIIAYHGSPYKFDRFDPSFIGDGEGAQAYGHGLYFAENERVAQGYRDKLSPGKLVSPADIAEYYSPGRIVNGYAGQDKVVGFRPGPADNPWGWSVDVQSVKPDGTPVPGSYVRNHSTQPDPTQIEATLGRTLPKGGAMYQVGINAPPEHFLDWDAPLSEQHPKVKGALANIQTALPSTSFSPGDHVAAVDSGHAHLAADSKINIDGAALYRELAKASNRDPSAAAQALSDAGIPGIKYLDGGSRSAGEGTRNYVVFSPENIDILKRYGLPAALGTGALAGATATPNQADAAPQPGMFGSLAPTAPQ